MIQEYIASNGVTLFKVRVFAKSTQNPLIRVTKQQAGLMTKQEAEKEEAKIRSECKRRVYELEAQGMLLCDLIDAWYDHELKTRVAQGFKTEQHLKDYLGSLKKWFGEFFKEPVTSLTVFRVNEVFSKMHGLGLSYAHKKKTKQILKSVFDFGIQSGLLPTVKTSPTVEVVLKREEEKRPEILSMNEMRRLIEKAFAERHPWRRVWAIALLTGLRSGELYALEWSDIKWDVKTISVTKSYSCRFHAIKGTKTGYWRDVPISPDLEQLLREQFEETGTERWVFKRSWDWNSGNQAHVLRKFCFLHGLPSIKFHTLRACFATQLLRQGVEAAKVMKICGWRNLKTMQYYIRLAGIEVQGTTDNLKLLPEVVKASTGEVMSRNVTRLGHELGTHC